MSTEKSASDKNKTAAVPHNESRRTPRRVYRRPVGILSGGTYEVLQALALSETGLHFIGESGQYSSKQRVVATLILPGGGCVVARGEVAVVRGTQFHVTFAALPIQLRRLIRNYVSAKTLEESEQERGEAVKQSKLS